MILSKCHVTTICVKAESSSCIINRHSDGCFDLILNQVQSFVAIGQSTFEMEKGTDVGCEGTLILVIHQPLPSKISTEQNRQPRSRYKQHFPLQVKTVY